MFEMFYMILLILCCFIICESLSKSWNNLEYVNRDELLFTNVTAKEIPELLQNVTKWTSITVGPKCFSVGLMNSSLTVLLIQLNLNRTNFITESSILDLKAEPVDVKLLERRKNGKSTVVVIVAVKNYPELLWYTIEENKLVHYWSWPLSKNVTHINVFKIENQYRLLVANDQNQTTMDLYQFDIKADKPIYWLTESIFLANPTESSAFNNFQFNSFLSIPQESIGKILIYKYEDNHFVPYRNLSSYKVKHIVSFEIGFKSFIAFDGQDASIYQFTEKDLVQKNVSNSQLEGINYWLPVPIRNFRDDVVLLAQRYLDHGTHTSFVIEIITYNGYMFEEHEDISCHYFGEEYMSLACLLDENRGIVGATDLNINEKVALLVPRKNALFMVNSQMLQLPNPMEDEVQKYLKTKDKLQKMMDAQAKLVEELKNRDVVKSANKVESTGSINENQTSAAFQDEKLSTIPLRQSNPEQFDAVTENLVVLGETIKAMLEKIDLVRNAESKREFETIIINGNLEVEGETIIRNVTTETLNKEPATEMLEDIVMKNDMRPIESDKTFTDIQIKNLYFDYINGISANDLLYKSDDPIIITGNITFEGPVDAQNILLSSGKINDVIIKDEIVDMRTECNDTLLFKQIIVEDTLNINKMNNVDLPEKPINFISDDTITAESLVIPHNITVKNINGENFEQFLKQLCIRNLKCYIPGDVKITGDVKVLNNVDIDYLNGLKFPEEFILQDSVGPANITGKKNFTSLITAQDIFVSGLIDGVDPKDIITLNSVEHINGTIVFNDLEITEELNVEGRILGEYVSKFVPNRSLLDVDELKCNVQFNDLEVDGNITIENNLNDVNFENLLKDIVCKDEETVTITAMKTFADGLTVRNNLILESNAINNIPITSIVTTDTDQILNIENLDGVVQFENLFIEGLFGTINVTKLDEECVKLNGEQFISSTLIFKEELEARNLIIEETLNDLRYDEYLWLDGDREINNLLEFNEIHAENLFVQGNFYGEIEGFDLKRFDERKLSYHEDQEIDAHYIINNAEFVHLNASYVNNKYFPDLFNEKYIKKNILKMVNNEETKIENLHVNGLLHINTVNGKSMDDIIDTLSKKTDYTNILNKDELIFEDDVYFENIDIEQLSGLNFEEFLTNIVFKNETNVELSGVKEFVGGITVEKLLETKELNNIALENILTKQGYQEIAGPIIVHGDVHFDDNVEVREINDFPVHNIYDNFNIQNGTYIIHGEVMFTRVTDVMELVVHGYTDGKPTQEFLDSIVYADSACTMKEEIIFENSVKIDGNMALTNNFNGINLSKLVPLIVLTTKDANIKGLVTFKKPVYLRSALHVDDELTTTYLRGINTSTWLNNAVFVNKGLLYGNYTFEEVIVNDSITTDFLNDINMSSIIPLKEKQTIDTLTFAKVEVLNNIKVGNLVNGYYLPTEVKNTVMNNVEQEISSDIYFSNNVLVRKNLNVNKLNDRDANKIVTTDTNQTLTADYKFSSKVIMDSDLLVSGTVNGINITDWTARAVKISSSEPQNIYDDWYVKNNVTFEDDVQGNCLINDLDLPQIMTDVDEKLKYKYSVERALIDDYNNICKDLNYLYEAAKRQIIKFQYFEEIQHLNLEGSIQNVHDFEVRQDHYMLVSEYGNCFSHLLAFKNNQFYPITKIEMGFISQVITVYDGEFVYLVSRSNASSSNCTYEGTNLWKFENSMIEVLNNIDQQELLQESVVPGTFYGLNKDGVTEFKVYSNLETNIKKYRNWEVRGDNLTFIPRGLGTGLALRDGHKLFRLSRNDVVVDENYSLETEVIIKGNLTEESNTVFPGRQDGDVAVLTVGVDGMRRSLLAVAIHEEISVKGTPDVIKIYENPIKGKLFHKVHTYNPSSLVSVDFDNGETLLVFLENGRLLQIYQYKGVEGFKFRSSAKLKGSKLFLMKLPKHKHFNKVNVLGLVNGNSISIIEAKTSGIRIRDDLHCGL